MKNVIGFLVGIFIIFSVIYSSGIYTGTVEDAINKKGWGKPFLTEILDEDKTAISFIKDKSNIRVVICSQGIFGWRVKDQLGVISLGNSTSGFNVKSGTFHLKKKTTNYVVGIVTNPKIDSITYSTKNDPQENQFDWFTTNDGTRIFYTITNKDLSGVTYTAYSKENKVLYEKK